MYDPVAKEDDEEDDDDNEEEDPYDQVENEELYDKVASGEDDDGNDSDYELVCTIHFHRTAIALLALLTCTSLLGAVAQNDSFKHGQHVVASSL